MTSTDLISTADIARLAGESRATVGNWKRRYPDFPPERGRNARGPLYDAAEVQAWLSARKDGARTPASDLVWKLGDVVRSTGGRGALPVLLAVVAARAVGGTAWSSLVEGSEEAAPERLLQALPQLGLAERDVLRSILTHEPPETISSIAQTLDRYDDSTGLEEQVSALLDTSMNLRHIAGDFATPSSVMDLMVALAAPRGTLYDPCVGTGRLLARAVHSARRMGRESRAVGQEINAEQALIAQLYFMISGVEVDLEVGDTLRADAHASLAADCILADPPLGMNLPRGSLAANDPRWLYGDPASSDATGAWIQHIVYHLTPKGRAVMVASSSALWGGVRGRVLQRIIKANLLDAVVTLPSGTHAAASIPIALLIFHRDRPNGAHQGTPGPVLMIDIPKLTGGTQRAPSLDEPTVRAVAGQYEAWLATGTAIAGLPAAVVSYATLAEHDFALEPRRYTALPSPVLPSLARMRERAALEADLKTLLKNCRAVDRQLVGLLEGDDS